ncbi:HdeD family acid-resistance protein [Flexibacterium corallicola]|uniref:HdeD family acid-resistance protein n=1 Tax=Flexibacterium corallicola TaxID=3037259 RepID=UPI00286F67A9|nr:HdeD family acid-resistance protein [Pseudovibrio sp. M1P-2-3]
MTHTSSGTGNTEKISALVRDKWKRFLTLGILLLIGGFVVIAMPAASSIAVTLVIAFALIFVGAVQIVHAFSIKAWSGFLWQLITGLIAVLAGGFIAYQPAAGVAFLTIILCAAFIAQGISQLLLAFKIRPHDGWGWILASGFISIIAGLCIFFELPYSATWALGLVAGISIMFNGWSYIAIALAARAVNR